MQFAETEPNPPLEKKSLANKNIFVLDPYLRKDNLEKKIYIFHFCTHCR